MGDQQQQLPPDVSVIASPVPPSSGASSSGSSSSPEQLQQRHEDVVAMMTEKSREQDSTIAELRKMMANLTQAMSQAAPTVVAPSASSVFSSSTSPSAHIALSGQLSMQDKVAQVQLQRQQQQQSAPQNRVPPSPTRTPMMSFSSPLPRNHIDINNNNNNQMRPPIPNIGVMNPQVAAILQQQPRQQPRMVLTANDLSNTNVLISEHQMRSRDLKTFKVGPPPIRFNGVAVEYESWRSKITTMASAAGFLQALDKPVFGIDRLLPTHDQNEVPKDDELIADVPSCFTEDHDDMMKLLEYEEDVVASRRCHAWIIQCLSTSNAPDAVTVASAIQSVVPIGNAYRLMYLLDSHYRLFTAATVHHAMDAFRRMTQLPNEQIQLYHLRREHSYSKFVKMKGFIDPIEQREAFIKGIYNQNDYQQVIQMSVLGYGYG